MDLTSDFVNGANSIQVGASAGTWRVFPTTNCKGDLHVDLNQGGYYATPQSMGLGSPVKSFQKQ